MKRIACLTFVLLLSACALIPQSNPDQRGRPDTMDAFARDVREDLQAHEWQSLLAATDPVYYQQQVVNGGVPEPLYLARLFSIAREGNQIQEGEDLEWADLDRILIATLAPTGDEEPPYRYTGQATLESGDELRLDVWVTTVQGRFVITPQPPEADSAVQ